MESDVVSHPLDDEGPLEGARGVDPAGARKVSACGDAIVISASAGRPQEEQNRASSGRLAPHVGQTTSGFYPASVARVVFALRSSHIGETSQT